MILKPSVDDMITALKACAVETPQEVYPCEGCYLYPFSKDGRMSTGRTCFEHLTLDVSGELRRLTTETEKAWKQVRDDIAIMQELAAKKCPHGYED